MDIRLQAITALFDGNVLDFLVQDRSAWRIILSANQSGRLRLLSTHILDDEIDAIRMDRAEHWADFTALRAQLTFEPVRMHGHLHGVSKTDRADLMRLTEVDDFADFTADNPKHAEDALLALTAREHDAVLITADKRFRNRCAPLGIRAMSPDALARALAD